MSSPGAASSVGSTPTVTPASTPATSYEQHENQDGGKTPRLPKQPAMTRDFHLDTFFNPVWTSGPNVFSFAENGTVVRPERYELEPYPGYHDDRARAEHRDRVIRNSRHQTTQSSVSREAKPWKNVAITEQDDAEYDAMVNGAWKLSNMLGKWEKDMFDDYGDGKEHADRTKQIAQLHALEYNGNPPLRSGKW